jgi:hypothetical protein
MKILYVAGFRNEYNENVFIQRRKKAVILQFEKTGYEIDFLYNSPTAHCLVLSNSKTYYTKLLPCNASKNFISKTHRRLFKFSVLYSTLILKIIEKKLNLSINSYDAIIAENWENLSAVIPFVSGRKIIGRIYGTADLTERIEKNSCWKRNLFFRRMSQVVSSSKVRGIIFNSTGSRSKDLVNLLCENNKESSPEPVYLEMPNAIFTFDKSKKRLQGGVLRLLQAARMDDVHGFDLFICIVKRLVHEYNLRVEAHLVGDGLSYDKICEQVRQNNLTQYINLPGRLGLDKLKKLYEETDILINYYGFNPVIEALNYKTFVITREYGEIGGILKRGFSEKVYRMCLPECKVLKIENQEKEQYINEAVKATIWYWNNCEYLSDKDFIPINKITMNDFSQMVFGHYFRFLTEIKNLMKK